MLLSFLLRPFILFDADDGGSSGGGDDGGGSQPPPGGLPPEIRRGLEGLISRQGSSDAAAVLLYQENHQYREKLRQAEAEIKKLKTWLPKEGAVALEGDELKLWQEFQALNLKPDEIKALQGELTTTKEELGALRKRDTLREVAEAAGFKLPVLEKLGADLEFEIKEIEKEGKKEKVPHVKVADGQTTPLTDYAGTNWADFLPSLKVEPPKQQPGVTFPSQSPGGNAAPQGGVLDKFIKNAQEARNAQPNPLVPQQQ